MARTWSSSNRRFAIIGHERRSSAMPTLSSCRGSRICDGAAPRWCWNRRAPALLFRICDPKIATAIAVLSTPQQIKQLRRQEGFPGVELLALLLDCQILFKVDAAGESGLRLGEGDHSLVLWDFHDLLFHTRSTEGRHANPLGGVYPYVGVIPPPPAVRPSWPAKTIDLRKVSAAHSEAISPIAELLRQRHSTRSFDDQRPITLAELSQFLDGTARVLSGSNAPLDFDDGGHTVRPYPSAGAAYELELYLAVNLCEGLARGFYHYDAGAHGLAPIGVATNELEALLAGAGYAMDAPAAPQILITIAARFGRMSWKYSSIAYALVLKDVGVLTQTLYLMASEMGLGGCAIGITRYRSVRKDDGGRIPRRGSSWSIRDRSRGEIGSVRLIPDAVDGFACLSFPADRRSDRESRSPRLRRRRPGFPIGCFASVGNDTMNRSAGFRTMRDLVDEIARRSRRGRKRPVEGRDPRLRKIDNFLPSRLGHGSVFQKLRQARLAILMDDTRQGLGR